MRKGNRGQHGNFARDQRGAVAVIIAVFIAVMCGAAALAIDMNYVYLTQNRLQIAADAGSLAAAAVMGKATVAEQTTAKAAALSYVDKNMPTTAFGNVSVNADVTFGNWNSTSKVFTTPAGLLPINSVRVFARRSATNSNAMPSMLAGYLGRETFNLNTNAIATVSQGAQWNIIIVQDVTSSFDTDIVEAVKALKSLLDCFKDTFTPTSKIGLIAHTGFAKKYQAGSPLVDMPTITAGYTTLHDYAAHFDICGNGSGIYKMPACSGTNQGIGLWQANQMFAATTFDPGSTKAIILISDGEPNYSSTKVVCDNTLVVKVCSDTPTTTYGQLGLWGMAQADAAWAAGINVFTVYFNKNNSHPASARTYMQNLKRGVGTFSEAQVATELTALNNAVCTALQVGHLVD